MVHLGTTDLLHSTHLGIFLWPRAERSCLRLVVPLLSASFPLGSVFVLRGWLMPSESVSPAVCSWVVAAYQNISVSTQFQSRTFTCFCHDAVATFQILLFFFIRFHLCAFAHPTLLVKILLLTNVSIDVYDNNIYRLLDLK